MATLEQLRAVFGGTSDEDTILTAAQKLRMPVTDIANEVGFTAGGQWSNRFGGSIDNYQAGLYDVGSAATGALGLQGVSDWLGQRRQINERQSDFARQAAKEQGAVTSFKDIGGVGDAFNYLGGLAVDSAPYLGEALAGGLVARGAMTGTRAAMSAARELGMPAAVQAGQRSLARGSVAGAVAASYPSSVGDIMSNQREEAGVTDGATAALLGVPYAAANAFGLEGAAARAGLFRPAVNWFDQAGGIRGGLKRAGVTALTQGAQEGASETFQEVMNQAGRNAVNPAAGYTNPQAMERYLESFVGGGLLGGVAGAAGGGWRRSEGYKPPVSDNPLNPTDLLVVERGFDARKPLDGFAPEGPRPGSRVMAAPAEVPQWGLARGAMDPAPTHPTVGEATDLFRMPTDGEPRIVGGYDPRLAGLFVGPTQPGAAPFAFSPPLTGTAVPPLSPPVAVDPLGAATGPLYVDDVAEGNNRWREQPADIASPVIGRMESGRQIPISGADDPGLALARQRYEEQLRAAEEQKTKAAELQAQVEAAQARHAANRQAAVDALVDKKPDGSPVVPVRDREIATFTALRELHSAGVIDDATYADLAGRMREAYTLDDKMRPKALNAVAKEVASLKEQANAAGAGTDGAARSADVGRSTGDQRAPGQPGGVRPAGAQTAAQGVVGAGTTELGSAGGRGDGALTGEQIVERIQQLDPVEQAYVGRWLGVDLDDEGNLALREQGAESLRAMEKSLGVSYETVRERVKAALVKLGLPKGMKPKQLYEQLGLTVANTDLETLERNVDMSTPASEAGTGDLDTVVESTSEDALDGVGDTEVRVERAQLATDELVPEIPDQDPTGRQREVAGPIDEGSMDLEDRVDEARALTLDSALEGDVSAGRVTADDITEAQYFYEQNRQRGMAPWGRLDVPMRAAYVRTYARARLAGDPAVLATKKALYGNATHERTGTPADADAARGDARGPADGGNVATEEGGAGGQPTGSEVQAPRGPVSVVTKRKRRVVRPEPADDVSDESWGNQLERSRGDTAADTVYDRDQLEDDLLTFMNADSLGRHVLIVEDASELTNPADMEAAMDPSTRAWVRGNKAVLIANRIPAGQGRAIFLHEVGSHLGLQRLLGEQEFDALSSKIIGWASRGGNSRETQIAKRAMERVNQAGETNPEQRLNELVAYFIEEAVNAGVNPTALKYDTELGRLLRTLWAAFKVALRKLGVNPDKLTAQDVVDLAYGAARLNVTGRFHGAAAKVQQFRTKYIGTGEGAQAYGWGLYFSELRGVAEEYKRADVKRKSRGGVSAHETLVMGNGKALPFTAMVYLKEDGVVDAGRKPVANFQSVFADAVARHRAVVDGYASEAARVEELRRARDAAAKKYREAKWGSAERAERKTEYEAAKQAADAAGEAYFGKSAQERIEKTVKAESALRVYDAIMAGGGLSAPSVKQVKGNLYATDLAVREDELLDWVAPLDEQPEAVKRVLEEHLHVKRKRSVQDTVDAMRRLRESIPGGEDVQPILRYVTLRWAQLAQRGEYKPLVEIARERTEDGTAKMDAVRELKRLIDAWFDASDVSETLKAEGYENTGGGLYRYLESLAQDNEGPFAPDMRVDDFLDRMVAKYDVMDQVGPNYKRLNSEKLDRAMTPEEAAELRQLQADVREVKGKSAPERVSRWLDSIGVKGVKMPVNYTRGGTYDEGRNFVVFNEKNVIRALDNPANRVSRSVQYSKAPASVQVAAKLTEALPQPAKSAWTDIKDFAARKMPYVMTTFQIFEQFGDRLKRLGDMIRANDLMRQESTALQMKVDDIVKRWDKLPKAAGELLSQVALRATLLGAHPDKAWGHEANAHVPRERQGEYNELRQLYDRLKATSPEGVKLYHDALAAFEDQRQQLEKATERMFEQYGKVMPKVKRVPGPYFPLVRRGDYLAIGESPQLVALKKQLETLAKTEGNDEAIADLNSRIDQLEADGQHFWVSSHENRSGMENALKEYESRGLVGRRSMADQRLGALPTRNLHSTIAALTAEATKNLSKDGAKEVSNALAEILLRSLPEGHALERQAARKGVAGAMEDMKRAVAVAGRQNAYYIARLNHAKEVADALHEMGRDAKGDINLEHVYRELEQRHALNMQWHDTPWQDAIGKAAWTWFLGASPAFLAINAAQPWLVSAPVMAGEYGAGAATRELARATADAFKVMKQTRWKDGKFDLWSGIDPDTVEGRFMTRNEKGEQVSEERKALRELIQRGVIDEGLNPELAMYAESGGTGLLTKLSRAFGWPAQQVELVNRVATALAAFRLERAKQGGRPDAYQKALDKAYATVVNTHVDYGAENAPRVMREGGGIPLAKLVFQFRRYQQAMMYLLASNVAKLRNPAEQKMARATLGYLALTSGMAGGVVGLPLAGTVMFLKDLFGDDDDEEGDAKARLRNTLYDLTGDKTLADVLAKGIPTLFGMDVAERAGMGQVAQLFPRLDLSRSKTAEDKLGKTLVAVAGPAGGLAVQGMDAASFFGAGDWVRGTERLLPKMMADPLRAARERVTGQEDRKGEQLMSSEELNYWDTIRRVAGVSSVRESDRLEADRALKSVEQGMNDRRSRIHAEFRRALRSGDFEDVRGMIEEYNADHPDAPIRPKDESAWRKEAQRAVSERDPETGLKVTRRQQPLAEVQRFAQP